MENSNISSDAQKRQRIESSSPITKLGDDILVEILVRLPDLKFVRRRCKRVCRKWSSLISSPSFNRRWASTAAGRWRSGGGLITSHSPPESILMFFFPRLPPIIRRRFRVLDAFNDLLLCGFSDNIHGGYGSYTYVICNPVTEQWVALPSAPRKPLNLNLKVRLVYERSSSNDVDRSAGSRFRVVCMYQWRQRWKDSTIVDVFCSESGEWTEAACELSEDVMGWWPNIVSCRGELFWSCCGDDLRPIVAFNPFRLDLPSTTFIDNSALKPASQGRWDISVSQGVLHAIQLEFSAGYVYLGEVLRVWRLEEDRRSWKKLSEVWINTSKYEEFRKSNVGFTLVLHPENSEMVYIESYEWQNNKSTMFSCNLRTGALKNFAQVKRNVSRWRVFQPHVKGSPTPIPRYNELRGMYDGSVDCLFQRSNPTTRS